MTSDAQPFVHVLLFQCPVCGGPMSSAVASCERNPEGIDARSFALDCGCGWVGAQMGLLAKRRWVEGWS